MKRSIAFILAFVLIVFSLCSCSAFTETSREAIEVRYTPAVDKVETDYIYKYNRYLGEFVLVPDTETVHYDKKYEVRYIISYDDSTQSEWQTVDKEIYEKIKSKIPP